MTLSDPSTAFRLSKELLTTIDAVCEEQDLTRSQLFRRSITEYLKGRNVELVTELPSADPDAVVFE